MRRRLALPLAAAALALPAALIPATSASAEVADKDQVLSSFTQSGSGSYDAWNSARADQGSWAEYGFDWSTDYCSYSPDSPGGFPFADSCARHDFGYRNYKAMGTFEANKARLDSAFLGDMKRVCSGYDSEQKASCDNYADLYYSAVSTWGS
ncbi:hypothetical protein HUT18_10715 [Streptomyces sp. NA04227]|uniref:phospholipase n=1 Tax=Streptomyces sp. NA04227 TaxID=2742136 RepID=UPI001591D43A|nr:phospholipase [Streptomyces sp. NA04227]QKW06794.1 hypothetical protein HUT18_10715 [Streptomyces sp. NA04227]